MISIIKGMAILYQQHFFLAHFPFSFFSLEFLGFPPLYSCHKLIHTYLLWGEQTNMKSKRWSGIVTSHYPASSNLHPLNFIVPLVEQVKDGVVSIVTEDVSAPSKVDQLIRDLFSDPDHPSATFGAERSFGSGFIFHPKGYILTSEHVIGKSKTIIVKLCNGRVFEARRIHSDATRDFAVIKIDADCKLYPLPLGNSASTKVGEWVISIGSPTCAIGIKKADHLSSDRKG